LPEVGSGISGSHRLVLTDIRQSSPVRIERFKAGLETRHTAATRFPADEPLSVTPGDEKASTAPYLSTPPIRDPDHFRLHLK